MLWARMTEASAWSSSFSVTRLTPTRGRESSISRLNEGSGTALKESVSGKADAGQIDHIITDQPNGAYPGPTWVKDDTAFGDVLQCGNKRDTNDPK